MTFFIFKSKGRYCIYVEEKDELRRTDTYKDRDRDGLIDVLQLFDQLYTC